jgi:exodeoxyribonuclease VII large subunit
MAYSSAAELPTNVKVLSVGDLTRTLKSIIEEGFPSVWVSGEISDLSRPSSGHIYLTLKDAESRLRAVIWRSTVQRLRLDLRVGQEIIARGRLSIYLPHGEYKLEIDSVFPKGLGARELALRQLKEKLARLGYFSVERKKKLPPFPKRVALVTSPTGAAVRDILEILARRWTSLELWICPVRVQGEGAAEEIAAAINLLNKLQMTDVMIVGRGGGSSEDLWAFNAECVAAAIFASTIPVVSAVGHEIDLTIADMAADCRALTPSEAAERVVPHRDEIQELLVTTGTRLRVLLIRRLEAARRHVQILADRRCFRVPLERLRDQERKLDDLGGSLKRALEQRFQQMRMRLEAQTARLESLSPLNVLARGYTLTRREADRVMIRDPDQVVAGDWIITTLPGGHIRSQVESIERPEAAPAS